MNIDSNLHSVQFRKQREAKWNRLESLLDKAQNDRGGLNTDELLELPRLYRLTISSLSVARNYVLDQRLIEYLEALSTRAHFVIYSSNERLLEVLSTAALTEFPRAVRQLAPQIFLSLCFFLFGMIAGFVIVTSDLVLFYGIVPESIASGRGPFASQGLMRDSLASMPFNAESMHQFAAFLAKHNSIIALLGFGLGLAFGLPTILILLHNGAILGAMLAAYSIHHLSFEFLAWLSVHGTTELGAIILSCGAGLSIARALLYPRHRETRLAAAVRIGRSVGYIAAGAVAMLLIAAILESLVRQAIESPLVRICIGLTIGGLWLYYFMVSGRDLGSRDDEVS